jgi:DNA-binding transcriptional MerR regulator
MTEEEFLINELAKKAGVSVRTIRYYMAQDLLQAPKTRGRYARFNKNHLDRLELIKNLKDLHMTLAEIKGLIETIGEQKILDQLEKDEPSFLEPHLFTAELKMEKSGSAALDYLARISSSQKLFQAKESARIPSPPRQTGRRTAETSPSQQTWERVQLAPGVELNYLSSFDTENLARIQQLIEDSKKLFEQL